MGKCGDNESLLILHGLEQFSIIGNRRKDRLLEAQLKSFIPHRVSGTLKPVEHGVKITSSGRFLIFLE